MMGGWVHGVQGLGKIRPATHGPLTVEERRGSDVGGRDVGAAREVGVGGEVGGAGGGVGGVEVEERWRGVQVGGLRRQGGYSTSGRHSREATAQ